MVVMEISAEAGGRTVAVCASGEAIFLVARTPQAASPSVGCASRRVDLHFSIWRYLGQKKA